MDLPKSFASQYHAGLAMLEQAVRRCPEELWEDEGQPNPYWRVAYHALFFVDFYLQANEEEVSMWRGGREGYQFLGPTPWPPHAQPAADKPYTRQEILEYIDFCHEQVDCRIPETDFDAPSGFHWLPFDKLELQIYNIRHLQQHVGDLSTILLTQTKTEINWIGKAP